MIMIKRPFGRENMKKCILILMLLCMLSGCAAPEVYETVSDTLETTPAAKPMQMILDMPQEAAQPTLQKETTEKLYHCDGYTLRLQTLAGGDLE
jgi:PBP1b-binding outer membrane lipoprotein LpoB